MEKYNTKFFKDGLPEWKRKKDPVLSRIFYRPVSFYFAAICANLNISANVVSYTSTAVAIIACFLFLFDSFEVKVVGAILVNVWLLMDCVDGNLARCVRKQAFGEFADASSSYILVGLLGVCMGMSVYQTGGLFVAPHCPWIMLLGALASSSDTLMRLIYQKYKSVAADMVKKGVIAGERDKRTEQSQVGSWQVRVEAEFGIGGILPLLVLLGTVFNALDCVILYCLAYYGLSCVVVTSMYIRKTLKYLDVEI